MAVGYYSKEINFQKGESNSTNNISLYEFDNSEEAYKANYINASGTFSRTNISMHEHVYSGKIASSYRDVVYNRIYFFPSSIDVTGYADNIPITLEIWNAYLTPITLSSVTNVNLTGVVFSETAPYQLRYLEYLRSNIILTSNFNNNNFSNILFSFSNGYNFSVSVRGNRAYIFPFLHNWESPLVEKLSFLTDVIEAHSGKEQRIKLRKTPRKELQSQTLLAYNSDYNEAARTKTLYKNLMFVAQHKSFLVPIDQDARVITSDLPIGTTSINLDTTYRDFHNDGFLLLMKNPFYYHVGEIETVTSSTITLKSSTVKAFNKGDTIVPLRQVVASSDTISGAQIIDYNVEDYQQNWSVLVKDNVDTRPVAYTPTLYKSIPLLLTYKHNWENDSSSESYAPLTKIDFNVGQFNTDGKYRRNRDRYSLDLLFKNRQEYSEFLGFFNYVCGRLKAFWVPSYSKDLQITSSQLPTDVVFTAKYTNYTGYVESDVLRNEIIFIRPNGTYYIRTIVSSANNNDDTETFTINSALGVDFDPNTFEMVCFLRYVRLDSDTVEITYDGSSEIIRTKITLTGLLNNPNTEN